MQALFSYHRNVEDDTAVYQRFLNESMSGMFDLFLLMLHLLVKLQERATDQNIKYRQKHLATEGEKEPNLRFENNAVLLHFAKSERLKELIANREINNWELDNEYIDLLFRAIIKTPEYERYIKSPESGFEQDSEFIQFIYKAVIAPNDKLYDYLEDKRITWLDDLPVINTVILKLLKKMRPGGSKSYGLISLFKDEEDRQFGIDLLAKTMQESDAYGEIIEARTTNWDKDRIALIDLVLLEMAICEFNHFPSIPVKVTINEYLEIAKEYSTPKSSVFINGILDKLVREYEAKGTLNKAGRGLM